MRHSSNRKLKLILLLTGVNLCVLFFILWNGATGGDTNIDGRVTGVAMLIVFALVLMLMGDLMRRLSVLRRKSDSQRDRMHDAVESLSEAFALYSPQGKLLLCNRRWRQIYPWLDTLEIERWKISRNSSSPISFSWNR